MRGARGIMGTNVFTHHTSRAPRNHYPISSQSKMTKKKNDWFERFNLKPVLLNFGVFSCYLANDKRIDKTVKELFKIHFFRCV